MAWHAFGQVEGAVVPYGPSVVFAFAGVRVDSGIDKKAAENRCPPRQGFWLTGPFPFSFFPFSFP